MKRALTLIALVLLAGCDLSMRRQPKYGAEARADLWADKLAGRAPPEGAVAEDQPALDAAIATPPPPTLPLVQDGRTQYAIYCAPCHASDGGGNGKVVQRGFPRPPDLASARLRQADARHIFNVITSGYGVMYPFADRIAPEDRWAVVAYVRALQTARGATP